jgi:acyl-CoA synthetase (AMP-forming)/AMP-acid ligase II
MLDLSAAIGLGSFYGEMRTNSCYRIPGDIQASVKLVLKHQIRGIVGSPNQVTEFLKVAQTYAPSDFQIDTISVTGSTLSRVTAAQIKKIFNCKIFNLYGSSEVGLLTIRREDSENPFDLGSVFPGIQLEIVDNEDEKVAQGITGRIRAKSPSFAYGYFRDPESTAKFFKDGWFYPGDLGHFDKDNHLFLDGRKSELINAGGVKINPAKIDEFIIGKFGIKDAGTFGYVDSTGTEKMGIAVVVASDFQEQALLTGIYQFSGAGFPMNIYKVDQVIRNDRGKVSRLEIAKKYLQSIGEKN